MENTLQNTELMSALSDDDSGPDLKKIVNALLAFWLWFVAAILVCLFGAFLYLRYTTPVYKIASKILIKSDLSNSSNAAQSTMGGQFDIFNTKYNVNDEMEILQTHYMIEQVVNELQLNVSCFSVGNIKSTEFYKNGPFKVQLISLKDSTPTQTYNLEFTDNNQFTIENNNFKKQYNLNDTITTPEARFIVQSIGHEHVSGTYKIIVTTPDAATEKYLNNLNFDIPDNEANIIQVTLQETIPG
jgi:tyrosine-protein kinase Etk/Wzc